MRPSVDTTVSRRVTSQLSVGELRRQTNPPRHRGGFRRIRGHAIKLIVAGGILGMVAGVVVGGALGYRVGVYATWRLVTRRLKGAQ